MDDKSAHQMMTAYCEDCCDTGIGGLCPGEGCCEPHDYILQELKKITHYEEEEGYEGETYEYITFIHIHVEGMDRLNALCLKGWKVDNVLHRDRADVTLLLCRKR